MRLDKYTEAPESKADTVSASTVATPKRKSHPKTDLTPGEENILRQFVKQGKAIDKPFKEFLALGIKVKRIFALKRRGVPVRFEGRDYRTFEEFVEKNFPISGRQMRRWLAEIGETDQRFSNQKKALEITSANEHAPVVQPTTALGSDRASQNSSLPKLTQTLPTMPAEDNPDWTDNEYIKTCLRFVKGTLRPLKSDPKRFQRVASAIAREIVEAGRVEQEAKLSPTSHPNSAAEGKRVN